MRDWTTFLLAILTCTGPGVAMAAAPADLPALEQAWHGCVREAYAGQPVDLGKAVAQRGALDACRAHKDTYVSAEAATRVRAARPFGDHVRAWVASAAGSVVRPVTAWISALAR